MKQALQEATRSRHPGTSLGYLHVSSGCGQRGLQKCCALACAAWLNTLTSAAAVKPLVGHGRGEAGRIAFGLNEPFSTDISSVVVSIGQCFELG